MNLAVCSMYACVSEVARIAASVSTGSDCNAGHPPRAPSTLARKSDVTSAAAVGARDIANTANVIAHENAAATRRQRRCIDG
jgi:hypothetical protein